MTIEAYCIDSDNAAILSDDELPTATLCALPEAFGVLLPPHPFNVAVQEFVRYFNMRLGLLGSASLSENNLYFWLKTLDEDLFLWLGSAVRRKIKLALNILPKLLDPEGMKDPSLLLFDLALLMNADRAEQGFGLSPLAFFVHQTKGFSRFSKILEKIARAVIDEAMILNPELDVLMQKNLLSIDRSVEEVHKAIVFEQETIKIESSKVSAEIANISICREQNTTEVEPSLKESSAKRISDLNRRFAAFVGAVKQKINQLKSELSVVTGVRGIFSGFIDYFDRKKSESPPPSRFRFF